MLSLFRTAYFNWLSFNFLITLSCSDFSGQEFFAVLLLPYKLKVFRRGCHLGLTNRQGWRVIASPGEIPAEIDTSQVRAGLAEG